MTYLEIVQKMARESGVISGALPTTVVSQTGDLLKLVKFADDAWQAIQNHRNAWKWLRTEFAKPTIVGTARYTATAWSLDRFADWRVDNPATGEYPTSIYVTATGVSDENEIVFIPWELWKSRYARGTQTNNRPNEYSISPAMEFCLGPIPDLVYTVNGEYRKGNQSLSANTDTPEMPARFHDVIVQYGLELFQGHDEAPLAYANAKSRHLMLAHNLERDQLPIPQIGNLPLA